MLCFTQSNRYFFANYTDVNRCVDAAERNVICQELSTFRMTGIMCVCVWGGDIIHSIPAWVPWVSRCVQVSYFWNALNNVPGNLIITVS